GAALVASTEPEIPVFVLWIGTRQEDSPAAASRVAAKLPADFLNFWEEEGWPVSTSVRPLLGLGDYDPQRSAWDVYLMYDRGVRWDDGPVGPTAWAYNLDQDPGVGVRIDRDLILRW